MLMYPSGFALGVEHTPTKSKIVDWYTMDTVHLGLSEPAWHEQK
jgi:hypothetical protein